MDIHTIRIHHGDKVVGELPAKGNLAFEGGRYVLTYEGGITVSHAGWDWDYHSLSPEGQGVIRLWVTPLSRYHSRPVGAWY